MNELTIHADGNKCGDELKLCYRIFFNNILVEEGCDSLKLKTSSVMGELQAIRNALAKAASLPPSKIPLKNVMVVVYSDCQSAIALIERGGSSKYTKYNYDKIVKKIRQLDSNLGATKYVWRPRERMKDTDKLKLIEV